MAGGLCSASRTRWSLSLFQIEAPPSPPALSSIQHPHPTPVLCACPSGICGPGHCHPLTHHGLWGVKRALRCQTTGSGDSGAFILKPLCNPWCAQVRAGSSRARWHGVTSSGSTSLLLFSFHKTRKQVISGGPEGAPDEKEMPSVILTPSDLRQALFPNPRRSTVPGCNFLSL